MKVRSIQFILSSDELTTLIYLCRPEVIKQESDKMRAQCKRLQKKLTALLDKGGIF